MRARSPAHSLARFGTRRCCGMNAGSCPAAVAAEMRLHGKFRNIFSFPQQKSAGGSTLQECGEKKLRNLSARAKRRKTLQKGIPPLMRPFSCSACSGGLFSISFFSRVFTRFRSVFSRLDDERGTAGGARREAGGEKEEEKEEVVSAGRESR